MRSMLAIGFLVFLSSDIDAKIIYVNNIAGSNRNSGAIDINQGDGDGPLRTIAAALNRANRSDHISLANTGMPYQECIALQGSRHSGAAFAPFVLDGNGATLSGSTGHRVGITLYDVRQVVIHDLVVQDFQLDGINAHDNAVECALSKVTCQGNGRSGISVGGASKLEVVDCTSLRNGKVQLRTEGWSTTNLIRTRLVSTDGPAWTREPNAIGLGARLFVEARSQPELQGFSTAADLQVLVKSKETAPEAKPDNLAEPPTAGESREQRAPQADLPPGPTKPKPEKSLDEDPFEDDAFGDVSQDNAADPFGELGDEPTTPEAEGAADDSPSPFDQPETPAAGSDQDPFGE